MVGVCCCRCCRCCVGFVNVVAASRDDWGGVLGGVADCLDRARGC